MIHLVKKSLGLPSGKWILVLCGLVVSCFNTYKICIRNERSKEMQNTFSVVPKDLADELDIGEWRVSSTNQI